MCVCAYYIYVYVGIVHYSSGAGELT